MLNIMIETMIAMMILVPVFWMLNTMRFHSMKKTAVYFLFAAYLSTVYLLVGMPTMQFIRFDLSVTLIPFLPMMDDIRNSLLNVLLFVPLGMLLPFLWKRYQNGKTAVGFGFGMSLAIELLQIFTYRATDINDLITNTLGAAMGYLLFAAIGSVFPAAKRFGEGKNEAAVIILTVCAVMFFVQPYLATLYYALT